MTLLLFKLNEDDQLLHDVEQKLRENPDIESLVPAKPDEPLPQDCCGLSCEPCVFDIYRKDLIVWAKECAEPLGLSCSNKDDDEEKRSATEIFSRKQYRSLKLIGVEALTHDTNLYRFELPCASIDFPLCSHLIMR
uniref:Oxidoreductase-like domain-containing protein n=1 Tax=Plectus sambesii TaxID=2011161 RepID=A0A914VGY0_9BILA